MIFRGLNKYFNTYFADNQLFMFLSCTKYRMTKILTAFLILFFVSVSEGYSQRHFDGSYLWNSTSISYELNHKTEFVFANKDHFSNQINHMDYIHFDLTGYRHITEKFSLGLGIRQSESYKTSGWSPGNAYFFYGVYQFSPMNMKIKFSNRIAVRTFKISDTQYTFDNNTSFDFFSGSKNKIPKPFLQDEVFTNLDEQKVQTIRLYGGFHLFKQEHFAVDLYYCYQKTRPSWEWKEYNVFGINTKFRI